MSAGPDFDDMVKICGFYSGEGLPVEVDYEYFQGQFSDCWEDRF